jgi:hypothetical protein
MPDYRPVTHDKRLSTISNVILGVLTFGMGGLLAELALIAHYEDATQWIPLALLAVGLVAVAGDVAFSNRTTQLAIQITMVLIIAAGVLGVYFHFHGSREFQLEMDPQMRGTTLVWHVLRAKSPPTLAPGSMVQLGIIGLGYAYLRRTK